MSDDFAVVGADQFLRLSKALKAAGRTGLRRDLNTALRRAAAPLIPKTRAAALARLPRSGGLAQQIAREPQRVQVRTGERTAGVRLVVGHRAGGARQADRGVIRHPVFGNRNVWVSQQVPAGWFDEPIKGSAPQIRRDLETALEDFARRIVREVGGS